MQNAICATRKSGPLYGGLFNAPEPKPIVPASTTTPRKMHCAGPLHTSFCSSWSKTARSDVMLEVGTQPAEAASTMSAIELVKVRYACCPSILKLAVCTIKSRLNFWPVVTVPPFAGSLTE